MTAASRRDMLKNQTKGSQSKPMDALSKQLFGERNIAFHYEAGRELIVAQKELEFFGRRFEPRDYAEIVAALNNGSITVDFDEKDSVIVIDTNHPFYEINVRTIGLIDGKKTIDNILFAVHRPPAPVGVGARIAARQVKMAQALGFDQIVLVAAGKPGDVFTGYYTWPRLGYNRNITEMRSMLDEAGFAGIEDTNSLMMRSGGAAWWKTHGVSGYCVFDLRPESTSFKVLNGYLEENGIVVSE